MNIIDLLVKISKGEEVPKKIYYDETYVYDKDLKDYVSSFINDIGEIEERYLFYSAILPKILNDEVEIIEEEKKIEKIIISMDDCSMPYVANEKYQKLSYSDVDLLFASKINELIDVINKLKRDSDIDE